MYQFTYAEVVEDSPQEMRAREHDALGRAVDLLGAAQAAGARSAEAGDALVYTAPALDDFPRGPLGKGNDLPEDLARAADLDRHLGA